jgi:catechol 2,3-dioxygenase-like lactoylglutathione lyase family enzyme
MDATGVSHIAICVRDLDKSLGFYRDILGTRVAFDVIQDTTTGGLPHVYKHSRKTRRQVRLMYGVGVTSPTITMTSHPGEEPDEDPIKLDQKGISHLSFSAPDVKALAEELVSKGVQLAGPLESRMDAQGNLGNFYVYDPDGILI